MIDSSKKCNCQLAFELHNLHVCEKRSNPSILPCIATATLKSVNQILWCYHSSEISQAKILHSSAMYLFLTSTQMEV